MTEEWKTIEDYPHYAISNKGRVKVLPHVVYYKDGRVRHNKEKIKALISKYNALENLDDNYMSLNFGNTYFSAEDCKKIGYIREDLDRL